jgi:hypothetical protein
MKRDPKLKPGFYWVRFEGEVIVAERVLACDYRSWVHLHWHIPGSDGCFKDSEICERLSERLER